MSSFGGPASMSERLIGVAGSPTVRYILYLLAIVVVVITVLLVVDNFFPFLPSNPIGGPSTLARTGKTFWKSSTTSGENLLVPVSDSPTFRADTYTMSVQFAISDSRTPSLGKYRHILHRGSNPCSIPVTAAGPTGLAGIKLADLPANTESSYTSEGLPSFMNPGLFLHKYKNDLNIFVHTILDSNNTILESMTVDDLPLNTPISVGIVCNGTSLEVYVNCNLYKTLLLRGKPFMPAAMNQWFGRYCAFPMYGAVGNLQLWDAALGATDYAKMCRALTLDYKLPSCPSA